jgi:hypothetical protein
MKIPVIIYFCLTILTNPLLAQESEVFRLPIGLEVQARQLANTGVIRASLFFSWTEGADYAPVGAAWMMSRILPALGSAGMDSAAFQNHKDQYGTLSRIDSGRGWIAWTFDAMPSNADMMIQLLADESLRPDWAKSETLPEAIASANYDRLFRGIREAAIHTFRSDIGDVSIPQMPEAPIDRQQFITMWTNVIRRPEKAVLSIAGNLESISFKRLIHQHFGPWEGVRAKADTTPAKAAIPEWPSPFRRFIAEIGLSEVWIAWNLYILSSEDAALTMTLVPWLLRVVMPASDEIINTWQADPDGCWISAIGQPGVSSEKLESHVKSVLNISVTQDQLNRAVKARNDYIRANALHLDRALRQDTELSQPDSDALNRMIKKCMEPDNLAALIIGS